MSAALAHLVPAGPVVRLRTGDLTVDAEAGPLAAAAVLEAATRQDELPLAAKLVWDATGSPGVRAEIPHEGDPGSRRAEAERTAAAAAAWVAGTHAHSHGPHDPALQAHLADALAALAWRVEGGPDLWALHPPAAITPARLLVRALAGGAIRVALPVLPLRVAAPESAAAVVRFCLEAASRLRLVRLGARALRPAVLAVSREVVLPAGTALERWLREASWALATAHEETTPALRALAGATVAGVYLAARGAPGAA
jgi:hypothetical protein